MKKSRSVLRREAITKGEDMIEYVEKHEKEEQMEMFESPKKYERIKMVYERTLVTGTRIGDPDRRSERSRAIRKGRHEDLGRRDTDQ